MSPPVTSMCYHAGRPAAVVAFGDALHTCGGHRSIARRVRGGREGHVRLLLLLSVCHCSEKETELADELVGTVVINSQQIGYRIGTRLAFGLCSSPPATSWP